jgi:hypothetical protein
MSAFTTVAHDIVAGAKILKSTLLKAIGETPVIIKKIEADAPEVEALTSLVFPEAAAIERTSLDVLTVVANAIHDAGDAEAAKGLNVSFDQALINDIKALIPAFESFLKGKKI